VSNKIGDWPTSVEPVPEDVPGPENIYFFFFVAFFFAAFFLVAFFFAGMSNHLLVVSRL
jgi:VIT1/CCC1 family predicted Fe2+/Mn2+ transporter